ncbi:MAG: hypothetical protein HXS52_10855 [Theionarchaea archaeon]|nr:hypothetical protein [Theionarchaea archaeon]MBU7038419.1 hypothetical protein [Theionarchaea archaeon]
MHYELVAQCNAVERHHVIQKIEMTGGRIKDILEDEHGLLLFIEYDEPPIPRKGRLMEVLSGILSQIGDGVAFPTPSA